MRTRKSSFSSLRWIFEVSGRFARIDRAGRSAVTTLLATLGICFGVMTLIVVLSVMNGFQQTSVSPIMEISSYHLRAVPDELVSVPDLIDFCAQDKQISAVVPFYESEALIAGRSGRQTAALIRALPADVRSMDSGFARETHILYGDFDLSSNDTIVLGVELARTLGVMVGDPVSLVALSGGSDVSLISSNRTFTVSGVFECSYLDINTSFAFVSVQAAEKYFGSSARALYGIKLDNPTDDIAAAGRIQAEFPTCAVQSWREYNRSFFGTLRIEKNILMLLVCIIFIVVGINIYNGMRRLVLERSSDISILSALGGTRAEIRFIFIMRGFTSGFVGALWGAFLGILISVNIHSIFIAASYVMYGVQYLITLIFSPENAVFLSRNTMYDIYAEIPARIVLKEVLMIVLFGIVSPLWASWKASGNVLKMSVAEVLHDE